MNMKVSKRDISILLIVLGLIGAFCMYQFYFRSAMTKKKAYEDDNKVLQQRLNKLAGVDETQLIAEMAGNAEELKDRASIYPAAYLYEDLIMYLNNWQELPYEEMYNFPTYNVFETTMNNTVSGVIDWNQTERTPISASYMFGYAEIDATYAASSYKAFKDMINKIYLDSSPKAISVVRATMAKDTGYVEGSIAIDFFNVNAQDGTNVYTPVKIEGVNRGVNNIFGPTYTPTPTVTPTPDPRQQRQNVVVNDDDEE